ncbi:MAG: hypothetical protein ABJM43_03970 [Paracoccaceae bacterium]
MYTPISGKAHNAPTESEARSLIRDVIDTTDHTIASKKRKMSFKKRGNLPHLLDEDTGNDARVRTPSAVPAQAKAASKKLGLGLLRIRRKHFWWAGILAMAYWQPIVLAWIVGVTAFLILLAFLWIGAERIWKGVIVAIREIESRNPQKATRMRAKIQGFSERWDRVLDCCPDGWVDGLYMPDLKALETQDLDHATAVAERLRRLPDQV